MSAPPASAPTPYAIDSALGRIEMLLQQILCLLIQIHRGGVAAAREGANPASEGSADRATTRNAPVRESVADSDPSPPSPAAERCTAWPDIDRQCVLLLYHAGPHKIRSQGHP